MGAESYVTYREMVDAQENIKEDIDKKIEKVDDKVNSINEKVSHLNDLVLPLTVAMKQTAENTKEISESLKDFTRNQSATNGIFHDKIHSQEITIEGLKTVTSGITEKKKYNATVVVAILGLIGVFITGLFQLAPVLFTG